ncbi:unnamed protein product [Camellia sinensis]
MFFYLTSPQTTTTGTDSHGHRRRSPLPSIILLHDPPPPLVPLPDPRRSSKSKSDLNPRPRSNRERSTATQWLPNPTTGSPISMTTSSLFLSNPTLSPPPPLVPLPETKQKLDISVHFSLQNLFVPVSRRCVQEVLPPALDSTSDPPAIFDGTTRCCTFPTYARKPNVRGLPETGLQEKIKLVPTDLQNRPTWYKEKVYPPNKVPSLEHNNEVKGESLDLRNRAHTLGMQDPAKRQFGEELLSYTDSFNKGVITSFKADGMNDADASFDYIETAPSKFDDGPFLLGQFSIVDIAYAPFIERFQPFLLDVKNYDITAGRPKLAAWIEDYREHNDDTTVHFEVIMSEENLIMAKQEGLLKKFKLTTTINTSNMHLFDLKGVIKKYETPEQKVPARAVAAAAVARALAGLPPHQRYSLPSSSEELSSIYGSKPHGQVVEELEEEFYEEVVDAYALIRDVSGLAEKIQSFFMQEVLSVTHSVLKNILQEDLEPSNMQSSSSRLTYSDLCHQIPESKLDFWYQVMTNQEAVECIRNIKDAKAAAKHLTC